MTKNDLDDKLRVILARVESLGNAHPRLIDELKQAFRDEGYGTTPVLEDGDTQVRYYFDRTDKTWKKMRDDFVTIAQAQLMVKNSHSECMTGQEWYDRFVKECLALPKDHGFLDMLDAAKRASGVKE